MDAHLHTSIDLVNRPAARIYHVLSSLIQMEPKLGITFRKYIILILINLMKRRKEFIDYL